MRPPDLATQGHAGASADRATEQDAGAAKVGLERETVIVTGASGNLGAAVVRRLLVDGARILAVDRHADGPAPEERQAEARHLVMSVGDLSQKADADAVVAAAVATFGGVTALVNTVGGFRTGRVTENALDQWDEMMTLNARVAMVTSAAVLPALVSAGRGSVVHIAAAPALKAGAGLAAYAASKAAVMRLVEAIAAEHRQDRISANCILPGTIDTPQNRAAMPDARRDTWVAPDSIAALIAFLVSPEGAVVTGAAIPATGQV
jgi:NAD(P)-dependent dehydrogenase (short-subunit alcohol dehydrogenase family)